MRIIDARHENPFDALKSRAPIHDDKVSRIVAEIVDDVRNRGDQALLDSARKFDAPGLQSIEVAAEETEAAVLTEEQLRAIEIAAERVLDFHRRQYEDLVKGDRQVEGDASEWRAGGPFDGQVGRRYVPVVTAGVYVPGGRATYPSSVIMNVLPARAACVRKIVVTTPARADGSLDPAVLVALRTVRGPEGIRAFKIGGAAAVAAMAFGTETVPRVDKVVGPGNKFVNEAKRQLWGAVGLDGYAGPSEVCVLADKTTNAAFAAADLLTQIEHAPDNCAYLVCDDEPKLNEILQQADRQATGALREDILREALNTGSIAFLATDQAQAIDIVNAVAPEHLSVMTNDPERDIAGIENAGCIFLGPWSPEAAGDFCAGPSHTLPTAGSARFESPVNVLSFLKVQSVVRLTREELRRLAPIVEAFAQMEGFPSHGRGAAVRFEE